MIACISRCPRTSELRSPPATRVPGGQRMHCESHAGNRPGGAAERSYTPAVKLSRLELIATLTLALVAVPLAADAQPAAKIYRVGLLGSYSPTSPTANAALWEA